MSWNYYLSHCPDTNILAEFVAENFEGISPYAGNIASTAKKTKAGIPYVEENGETITPQLIDESSKSSVAVLALTDTINSTFVDENNEVNITSASGSITMKLYPLTLGNAAYNNTSLTNCKNNHTEINYDLLGTLAGIEFE